MGKKIGFFKNKFENTANNSIYPSPSYNVSFTLSNTALANVTDTITVDIDSNLTLNQTVYYELVSSTGNVTTYDFFDQALSGSLTLDGSGNASFTRQIRVGSNISANSSMDIVLRTGDANIGDIVASNTFNIVFNNNVNSTGGTITDLDGYNLHTFSSNANLSLDDYTIMDYIIVAGGGGGGNGNSTVETVISEANINYSTGLIDANSNVLVYRGAGGGAGGMLETYDESLFGNTFPVIVGVGGSGGIGESQGANGTNSSFKGYTTVGGGGGAGGVVPFPPSNTTINTGYDGGSGGGGGYFGFGSGTTGQGNDGGAERNSAITVFETLGGGGGASEAGKSGVGPTLTLGSLGGLYVLKGGHGGNGNISGITGANVYYAGGGASTMTTVSNAHLTPYPGGPTLANVNGLPGLGGGGNVGVAGTDGTGGGGGAGADGGDGVVIVKVAPYNRFLSFQINIRITIP